MKTQMELENVESLGQASLFSTAVGTSLVLLFGILTLGAELLDAEVECVSVGGGGDEMLSFLTRALFNSTLSLS